MKATSGINAVNTKAQHDNNIDDQWKSFFDDTHHAGNHKGDVKLVETLAKNSTDAWNFLANHGIVMDKISQCGGHSQKRTHRPGDTPTGFTIISSLRKILEEKPNVQIKNNSKVEELIYHNDEVKGVKYKEGDNLQSLFGTVILATGGFGNDKDGLLKKFGKEKFPTTNGSFSTGDGIKIATNIGADVVNLEDVQVHPTGFIDPKDPNAESKILGPELLRGVGGILLDKNGKRFCNELGLRKDVTAKILDNCDGQQPTAFIVLSKKAIEDFGKTSGFYIGKGFLKKYSNGDEIAKDFNFDPNTLHSELFYYNMDAKNGIDKFGKKVFPNLFNYDEEMYAGRVTPSVHYCMGGLKINEKAQVLKNGTPINGLYAVGEVTGGIHGDNRLVGNGLLESIVFGRIAGKIDKFNT